MYQRYRIVRSGETTADGLGYWHVIRVTTGHTVVGGFERYELAQEWIALRCSGECDV